jgi:outer membrane protein assembly factor BamB
MKIKRILSLIIIVAFLFNCRCYFWGPVCPKWPPCPPPCKNVICGIKYTHCEDSLYRMDLDSLKYETITSLSIKLPNAQAGLDFNIDGTLYLGVAATGDLYEVNTATGAATLAINIPLSYGQIMRCVAFAPIEVPGPDSSFPAGTLFGAEDSILHAINIETGKVQVIGDVGRGNHALAFSLEGILYGLDANNSLHIISTETANSSEVIANPLGCGGLTSVCNDFLYSADTRYLYRLDPETGDMEIVYDLGHTTAGLATMP